MKVRRQQLILVVDDDLKIAQLVEAYLRRAGYQVAIAQDGLSGLKMIRELSPDLVVLDLMLPELDGQAVARTAREETDVSIIMLTALGTTAQRIAGLEIGADDYVAKPFQPAELVARVRSVLRRTRADHAGVVHHAEVWIDPARRLAKAGERALDLTPTEFELLHALVRAHGRVLTREFLIESVLRSGAVDDIQDRSIDVYVRRLRTKLGDEGSEPRHILTVRGVGYRMADG
jgi:DNA-binding response OmpR family regulator